MRNKVMKFQLIVIVIGFAFLIGCETESVTPLEQGASGNESMPAPEQLAPVSKEPVTLTMMKGVGLTDEHFQLLFAEPIEKRYPNITIEMTSSTKIAELIAAGETPDLIATHVGNLRSFVEYDVLVNIIPLAKQHDVDLNRFDPIILEALEATGPNELNGLPFAVEFGALYYNKDLFNKFAADYPEDGMTWDEAIELSKKLARTEGNVAYKGLDPYAVMRFQRVMGNTVYNPDTMQATADTEEWRTIFRLLKKVLDISGNEWTEAELKRGSSYPEKFYRDQVVAMYAGYNFMPALGEPTRNGFDWDVVQYPSMPERMNIFGDVDSHLVLITKTSKHQDAAMQALIALTSDETQLLMSRSLMRMSPLQDSRFKEEFGADVDFVQGKNLQGIFKSGVILSPPRSQYFGDASNAIRKAFHEYYKTGDLNSALRMADEEINQFLREKK